MADTISADSSDNSRVSALQFGRTIRDNTIRDISTKVRLERFVLAGESLLLASGNKSAFRFSANNVFDT